MKLAFYYHIPVVLTNQDIFVPGYLGVFIDALANEVDQLVLVAHTLVPGRTSEADYKLKAKNITLGDLGKKTPAWHRELFPNLILKKVRSVLNTCDILLIRAPTPLAAHFKKVFPKLNTWFMIVGDYLEGIDHYKNSSLRNKLIYYYLHINDYFFQKQIRTTPILVNSPALYDKYINIHSRVYLIKTTTLTTNDFFYRYNTCLGKQIELVYTGSFSPAKGLFELIDALAVLKTEKIPVHLHLVGWEDDSTKPVQQALVEKSILLGIKSDITIHGKKNIGNGLNAMYRLADIYIIPSYHEGFPRTIWEAMANGAPVIATNVGGIPGYIKNNKTALLIEPKNVSAIVSAVKSLIYNEPLRTMLIANAYELVKDNTLEIQTKKLIEILHHK